MPTSNISGCECKYTGKEAQPTGLGHCPQCHPKGARGIGIDRNIWVIKTDQEGTNYWAKVPTTSIHKDGGVWRCTDCVKVETPLPEVQKKVVCVAGVCKEQPTVARFYEFDTDVTQAISIHGATYGDVLARKNTYKCEESYIIDKQGVPQRLSIDSNSQCVIPDNFLNDLGIFYWDKISIEADLGYPYNRKHFEELCKKFHKGDIHMEGLLKEYGTVIVTALSVKPTLPPPVKKRVSKKVAKKRVSKKVAKRRVSKKVAKRRVSKKVAKKRVSKKVAKRRVSKKVAKKPAPRKAKGPLDKRSVAQLRALAKERGRKVPSGATKAQLLQILRGKKTVTKRRGCYEAMTRTELLERAAKKNVKGRSSMTKEKLIHALRRR